VFLSVGSVQYEEKLCRSALQRVTGMSFRWSLNPYQGCVHGCQYCYARRYHGFLELDASQDFPTVIFVKTNVADQLRQELRRPGWIGETVMLGTATDSYQPIEGRYRLTQACLQALLEHDTPVSIVTKGTLILRDLELLAALSRRHLVSVCFSLTTLKDDLWHRLEPGTPPPKKRLQVMRRLVENGIRAGVLVAPVIPGLTDDRQGLEAVVKAAAESGAHFLGAQTLYLKPGTREHFLAYLQHEHPGLMEAYRRLYPGDYAPKRFQDHIQLAVSDLKAGYALKDRTSPKGATRRQLTLGL
jgi:DNA repair photolyase